MKTDSNPIAWVIGALLLTGIGAFYATTIDWLLFKEFSYKLLILSLLPLAIYIGNIAADKIMSMDDIDQSKPAI